jgi:ATP-dependent Lon protease
VTIATSLVSALTKTLVRHDVAMTGEVTLRGRVLPIGGLKEKVLAAHRAGITHVLIPEENAKDIQEIPATILKAVKIETVEHMDEVLRKALVLNDPERFLVKQETELSPASLYPSEPSIPAPTSSEIVTH